MSQTNGKGVGSKVDSPDPMFTSPHAPDVGIGGAAIFRSTLTFTSRSEETKPRLAWSISGFPASEDNQAKLMVMGDLLVEKDGWFLGVTSLSFLYFRHSDAVDNDNHERNAELLGALAPWVSNVLYDTAAGAARSLLACQHQTDMEIPILTPKVGEVTYTGEPS